MKDSCIIFEKLFANGKKTVNIYCENNYENVEELIVNYDIYYHDGKGLHGYAAVELKNVLEAYGFTNYDMLKNYLYEKYKDNLNSWKEILNEFKEKGLDPYESEDESFMTPAGNPVWTNINF